MHKKDILICDDQERFIKTFKQNHSSFYDIEEELDIRKLMDKLGKHKPDLVLLDLYHPRDDNSDFETRRQAAEIELKKLDEQIKKTKDAVEATWTPLGLDILQDIRKKYNAYELPVIIYTQRGLFLMNDEQVRLVEENKGHWMLKNEYTGRTEKARMDRIIANSEKVKKLRRYIIMITGAVVGLLISLFFFQINVIKNILVGAVSSLIAYFISNFIDR
jgi:CheY-like chemotaxis protein